MRLATTLPPESGLAQTTTSPRLRSFLKMRRAALFTKRMSPERTEGSMLGPAHCGAGARGTGARREARVRSNRGSVGRCARESHHNDAGAEVGGEQAGCARLEHHHRSHMAQALSALRQKLWQAMSKGVARPPCRHNHRKSGGGISEIPPLCPFVATAPPVVACSMHGSKYYGRGGRQDMPWPRAGAYWGTDRAPTCDAVGGVRVLTCLRITCPLSLCWLLAGPAAYGAARHPSRATVSQSC